MAKVNAKQQAEIARAQMEEAARAVLVTTGDVQAKYSPVNIVFALGGSSGGVFTEASPQIAFEKAMFQLQLAALALGGNAVVHCAFAYQSVAVQNLGCSSTAFTVSGYGTVVRFV